MKKFTYILSTVAVLGILLSVNSATAVKHTVLVGNYYFNPSNIPTVVVGDTIKWQWVEGGHTTTSTSIPSGAASWDSPINSGNQVYEYKVTVAGTYNYKCTPHAAVQLGSFTATGGGPTLTVTPSNQNVSSSAGSTNFSITSNSSWTASSNQTWCTLTSTSGTGNATLTANYSENSATSERIATITVTVSGISPVTVTVTQSGMALYLLVEPSNQNVSSLSGSTTFDVSSNTSWNAVSDASWCTVTPGGTGNGTIIATYTENPSASERVAQVTVSGTGIPTEIVTVTQEGSGLGVEYNPTRAFRIYPNPTSGMFTLIPGELSNLNMELCVLDLTGKTLHSGILSGNTSYRLNIGHLPEGIYFVRIKDGETSVTQRIVKSVR